MNIEKQKCLKYWIVVESKFKNKKRTPNQNDHYKHALKMIKELKNKTN